MLTFAEATPRPHGHQTRTKAHTKGLPRPAMGRVKDADLAPYATPSGASATPLTRQGIRKKREGRHGKQANNNITKQQ